MGINTNNSAILIQFEEFGINERELILHFGELYVGNLPEWEVVGNMCKELNQSLLIGDAIGANRQLDAYIEGWKKEGVLQDGKDIPLWIQHFISFVSRKIISLEQYTKKLQEPESEKLVLDMGISVKDIFSKS